MSQSAYGQPTDASEPVDTDPCRHRSHARERWSARGELEVKS
jgi:hypothetical protein